MRGSELAEAMAVAVDQLVSAREGTGALDRAIESIVGTIGRFGGKNATSYLEAYRAEMIMRDIPGEQTVFWIPWSGDAGRHAYLHPLCQDVSLVDNAFRHACVVIRL